MAHSKCAEVMVALKVLQKQVQYKRQFPTVFTISGKYSINQEILPRDTSSIWSKHGNFRASLDYQLVLVITVMVMCPISRFSNQVYPSMKMDERRW